MPEGFEIILPQRRREPRGKEGGKLRFSVFLSVFREGWDESQKL